MKNINKPANTRRKKRTLHNIEAGMIKTESIVNWPLLILALTFSLAPAMGVPSEEMLQDTLKSIIISFGTLGAAFAYVWQRKNDRLGDIATHPVILLPITLAVYALCSMVWSHTYLAGVEVVRWLIFSLLLWVGFNILTFEKIPRIATGIHLGAIGASVWGVLQFLFDFSYFPQGPNPASTFVNRNFFAEYLACSLPYSIYLLSRERKYTWQLLIATSTGFNISALLMTGTRSALIGLLLLVPITIAILIRYRHELAIGELAPRRLVLLIVAMLTVTAGLSSIPAGNTQLASESNHQIAIGRAISRTILIASPIEYTTGSFSIRTTMWKATGRMIEANPVVGVGAGAWEVAIPLYQDPGTQIETDFYAHNEILQLLAEYGLIGWAFLLCLITYLIISAVRTKDIATDTSKKEAPLRAFVLLSLLILLLVSNAGFPWRLAPTGAIFSLSLAILAASDIRLGFVKASARWNAHWTNKKRRIALWLLGISFVIATYITQQAFVAERNLVRAIKIALTITKSGNPNDAYWDGAKQEMLAFLRTGIAANPHYRKLTPMAADELASWGDWRNAIWIWESVLASRPNVVAIVANLSKGYMHIGDYSQSKHYLERAIQLQPNAQTVKSMHAILLSRLERYTEATVIIKELLNSDSADYDLVYTAYLVGMRTKDWQLALQALNMRIKKWPDEAYDGWLRTGDIYARQEVNNPEKALESYKRAIDVAPDPLKDIVWSKIPATYQSRIPK